jgi:hypothetical protein
MSTLRTSRRFPVRLAVAAIIPVALLALATSAGAAELKAPAWKLEVVSTPTNLAPNAKAEANGEALNYPAYAVVATNIGGAATSGPISVTVPLPAGLNPLGANAMLAQPSGTGFLTFNCAIQSRTVVCNTPISIVPGNPLRVNIQVEVENLPDPSTVTAEATIEGGGAAAVSAAREIPISSAEPAFGFLPGATEPSAAFSNADGTTATQAGSHPFMLTVSGNYTSRIAPSSVNNASGDLRDNDFELPPGVIINPNATKEKCTMVQLELGACPVGSQIGEVQARVGLGGLEFLPRALFNMVPPRGVASDFAFNFAVGLYFHITGGVETSAHEGGNYALGSRTESIPSAAGIIGIQAQFWGDPTNQSFEFSRGGSDTPCRTPNFQPLPCPVEPQSTSLLTAPTSCPSVLPISARIDSWQRRGEFVAGHGNFEDLSGTPTGVSGCASVEFNPTLKARPTNSVADSPTGFEADVGIPQQEKLGTLAQSDLKDITVDLPQGMSLNPSAANGLGSCSSAQIGIDPNTGVPNEAKPTCPADSQIGKVEVETPLLPNVLPGHVYLATPHDNPFNSLIAIYATVEDPLSGTLIKLPGKVELDEATGQVHTSFDNDPQIPFTHFKLNLFGGAGASLRTPATCGRYATNSTAQGWSGNPAVHPSDEYEITSSPAAGACPSSSAAQPNSPSFDAGTATPIAAVYSPFVLNLRREDGSQEISKISLTAPPGLTGKLAGIPYCSDAAIEAARSKSGAAEQAQSSCPSASALGSVIAGAGAGPTPYYAKGSAYLAGPYKGAPLSMVFITPAVAGPFDLGTIVVRAALHVDSVSGQINATTDEIPHILKGIPLDIRTIQLKLDRADFTKNGTSCNPFSVTGSALSTQGSSAALSQHFQLGECRGLSFKPALSIRLKGKTKRSGNPALTGTLTMPPGGANLAGASVALPHSEFLDQSHIGTVCTRVQFAEGNGNGEKCPAASVYGSAKATSPLVDYPLEGNVFLRSSSHELPDLVLALHGPSFQPLAVEASARIDSVHGGIRTSFESAPDLPISSVVLSMAGGKKGLLENSTNICVGKPRAKVTFTGQNGKVLQLNPLVKASNCKGGGKKRRGHRRHAAK